MSAYYRVNFDVSNNEDLRQPFRLTDEADVPANLTGAVLTLTFEDAARTEVINASTANGKIVIVAAATGDFEIRIPVTDLSPLRDGVYAHDLVWVQAGVTRRPWSGTLTLARGIT